MPPGSKKSTKRSNSSVSGRSRSARAGISFPVGRIHRLLKKVSGERVGASAAVYLGAVLEYLTAELFELAGNACKLQNLKRVMPRHLMLSIRGDEELDKLVQDCTIAGAGVIPHVHLSLIPKKSSKKEEV